MDDRSCPGCEERFTPRGRQKYCSRRCQSRLWMRARLGIEDPGLQRPCRYCQKAFLSQDGRQYYCSDECTRTAKSLRQAFRLYGITMAEYRPLWLVQEGVCAICQQPERTARNRLLVVDHDHITGHVRGLLCSQCNRAIGLLDDSPETLEAAASYVRKNRQMKLVIA